MTDVARECECLCMKTNIPHILSQQDREKEKQKDDDEEDRTIGSFSLDLGFSVLETRNLSGRGRHFKESRKRERKKEKKTNNRMFITCEESLAQFECMYTW